MNQAIKKTLCIVLTAFMLLTAAPLSGFVGIEWPELNLPEWNLPDFDFNLSADAAEVIYFGTCGENLTWTLDDEGTLVISGTGDMTDYSSYYVVPWYSNRSAIKKVVIENGVTSIGEYAFYDCRLLTSVTIPDSVTSIGRYAFFGCTSLTSVTIPDSVTSIGYSAFEYCTSLTSITIPDSVTSIGDSAFSGCRSLTSVTIPDSVTSIGDWTFSNCTSLTSVTIPDSVTSIGEGAFCGCTKLTSVTIPDSVMSIGDSAFESCTSLTSVTISDSVKSIGEGTFRYCTSLTSVTIPDSVTSIGIFAFYNCTSLTSVIIPDSVTSIGRAAFAYGALLTSVIIGDSVTSIGEYAFEYCTSLTSVTIPDSVTSIGDSAFYNCTSLTSVTIPDSVTSIGYYAFNGCKSLTSITIPDNVTSIGEWAFCDCTKLTSVTIPDSVTSIGYAAFNGCKSLTDITVNADNTAYCSEDGALFNKSKTELIQYPVGNARTSYTIPDSVTSIGNSAFGGCDSLTSVTIPDSVTSIGWYAFSGCTKLTSVTIPDSVTSIGDWTFFYCTSLTSVTIGDSVTSIGEYAFEYCSSLTSVTIPDSVTSIRNSAFYGCTKLTSVTIPDSVTSIGGTAFFGCTKLTSVTIPDSVTSIGEWAFSNCPALVIRGYLDSYAQQYAESKDIPFIALNADPFVNLSGGSVTPTSEFTVYGLATPLQTVSLYCEDVIIGTATAGGNGRYTLTATLPAPEDGKTYTVVAKISVDGVDYESEPLQVTYNSDSATLNTLVFTHSCYDYTITSETLNFVAPTISINTSSPMYFTITLNGKTPDTLTVVSTKNGVRKTMPATYDAADGKWYASGWFDSANKSYVPGEITLEYDDGKVIEVPFKAKFIVDPSGYVYEAVKSNVVEDAVAIVQYKDENGNAAFWDADAYDQVNPQITKADGYFSWFVPEGEWQVKVIKNGYQTALSDWYTVPPEVTGLYIPLVTTSSAWVDYCNVFADYAEIKFSQYMQIDSVINGNVTFGEATGTWEAVDKEVSGTDENVYYATTFRFTPDTAFSGDVTVNIANVTNYAGRTAYSYSPYTETVTVTAPIENFTLSATELTLAAGTQATVELDAGAAAAGKTVSVQFGNEAVASAAKTVTLDENGKASLTVKGNAFGATTATFALAGTSLTAECTVTVTAPTAVEPVITLGDVDGNGKIEAADARLALRAAVKLETLTAAQTKAADADKNGEIEAADARLILRAAVGLGTLQ